MTIGPTEPAGLPPYLVLLRVGFTLPAALLQRRCALTAPFHPYLASSVDPAAYNIGNYRTGEAVCFLWHFPSIRLEPDVPDVIRHTALRSSDFPLLASEDAGSGRPVRLPTESIIPMRKVSGRLLRAGCRLSNYRAWPLISGQAECRADKLASGFSQAPPPVAGERKPKPKADS
jgi:hypothetical protein